MIEHELLIRIIFYIYNTDNDAINYNILKNVIDVYVRVYFPKISQDDIKYIINYINNKGDVERNRSRQGQSVLTPEDFIRTSQVPSRHDAM